MHHTGTTSSSGIPSPDIFKKAIYMLNIGQNDLTSKIAGTGTIDGVMDTFPQIVSQINDAVKV